MLLQTVHVFVILLKMKLKISILIAAVLITAVLVVWATTNNSKTKDQVVKKPAQLPREVVIALDKKGFFPPEKIINAGTAVRWKNISGEKQTVNSDDYPTNQLHKELNFGIFEDGSSVVYIFKKSGKFGYHNQLKPDQKGIIIVSE